MDAIFLLPAAIPPAAPAATTPGTGAADGFSSLLVPVMDTMPAPIATSLPQPALPDGLPALRTPPANLPEAVAASMPMPVEPSPEVAAPLPGGAAEGPSTAATDTPEAPPVDAPAERAPPRETTGTTRDPHVSVSTAFALPGQDRMNPAAEAERPIATDVIPADAAEKAVSEAIPTTARIARKAKAATIAGDDVAEPAAATPLPTQATPIAISAGIASGRPVVANDDEAARAPAPSASTPAPPAAHSREPATAVTDPHPTPNAEGAQPAVTPLSGAPPAASSATVAPSAPNPSAANPAAAQEPVLVAAHAGRIGHETGVAIARHAADGRETVSIRLDPIEMGRIEVRLSFGDDGALHAVVAADNPASLELLRRESLNLMRALSDAGIATDSGNFRFDTRSDGRGSGGDGGAWQRPQPRVPYASDEGGDTNPDTATAYHWMAARGRVEILA